MPSNYRNAMKLARCSSHISFLRRCRNNSVIPRGLRAPNMLRFTHNNSQAQTLAHKHSKQWLQLLLNIEYNCRANLQTGAIFPLTRSEMGQLTTYENKLHEGKLNKFVALLADTNEERDGNDAIKAFQNLSNGDFNNKCVELLNKGPNFKTGLKPDNTFKKIKSYCYADIIKCADKLERRSTSSENIAELCGGLINLLNRTENELHFIKRYNTNSKIRQSSSTVIIPTDKSARLVALDKEHYTQLLNDATIATGNFNEIRLNQPSTRQSYFNKSLVTIAKKYEIEKPTIFSQLNKLKCSCPTPSAAYVLPKDHKPGNLTGRPIIAAVDGPAVSLSKFLSKRLNNLLHRIPAHLCSGDELNRVFLLWITQRLKALLLWT